jgi:hypothetical protein
VSDALVRTFEDRGRRATRLSEGRYAIELPLDSPPERLIPEIAAAGARLVSINPVHQTLEDFFVQQVTSPQVSASGRGFDEPVARGRS